MSKIAIITARGGSKRIPKKNIKDFLGKPIIAYSIEAAIESDWFDRVMVSTDSEEIADIARRYGAEVPFMRSEATSNDYAVTFDVIKEVIEEYRKLGQEFEYGCCIYPTAPLISAGRIKEAMTLLEKGDADVVEPVVAFSFPPQRGVYIRDNKIGLVNPETLNIRSQDLETVYHDAGTFYPFRVKNVLKKGKLITDFVVPFELPEMEVQDIDNLTDWELAELKYKVLEKQKGRN